jgi:hypothetical protein
MITSNDDVMELKIEESILPSTLLKSHHHHHESSGYSSKEAECSSPENKTHIQHRHHENKLRITANNNNNNNSNRTADIHRRRHKLPTSSTTVSNSGSLTIDESSTEPNNTERMVRLLSLSLHHIRLQPKAKKSQYCVKRSFLFFFLEVIKCLFNNYIFPSFFLSLKMLIYKKKIYLSI